MVTEILDSKFFNPYPLDWTQTQIYQFSELPEALKSGLLPISYEMVTYNSSLAVLP